MQVSIRIMNHLISFAENIGLVVEGRRRNTVFTDGKFYDEILYGLIKDEFSELVK